MEPSAFLSEPATSPGTIAILGARPAGLVLAISLARRGLSATVIERDVPPDIALRFNPDRSYTIDISGHGLKALRHIEAVAEFDRRTFRFKGLKIPGRERRSGHCLGGPDRGATFSGRLCRSWTNIRTGLQWSSKPTWKASIQSQVH